MIVAEHLVEHGHAPGEAADGGNALPRPAAEVTEGLDAGFFSAKKCGVADVIGQALERGVEETGERFCAMGRETALNVSQGAGNLLAVAVHLQFYAAQLLDGSIHQFRNPDIVCAQHLGDAHHRMALQAEREGTRGLGVNAAIRLLRKVYECL